MLVLAATMLLGARGKLKIGDPAPPFQLTLIDGSKLGQDDLKGQVVVLNYWATWCVPCRKELPLLDSYYVAQKQAGLRVFAVTTEDSVRPALLKNLFAAMHITPVRKIGGPYADFRAVPMNYVIDRAGRLRYAKAGSFDLDALNDILVPLLMEPPPG